MKKLLITGGAGYIGSHALLKGIQEGYQVKVVDSLIAGHESVLQIIEDLTKQKVNFSKIDIRDKENFKKIVDEFEPDYIMNFAALKSVGEAEKFPEEYYDNNVNGLANVLSAIKGTSTKLVFSSTAAVYDPNQELPLTEESRLQPIGVYGKTKLKCEKLIQASDIKSVIFRYFNVVGNHPDGVIGEYPEKTTNLLPLVLQALAGKRDNMTLFGCNFNTRDGSQERDYIDVNDLVDGHFLALQKDFTDKTTIMNLGTGNPASCLELFKIAEEVTGSKLDYKIVEPRAGDPEKSFASADKALKLLDWKAKRSLKESIEAQWKWMTNYYNNQ
jgi:UDP-glucose 4-epimerase